MLTENPDILARSAAAAARPALVVGFAAETENLIDNARAKRKAKGADWIVANDVSPASGIMGGAENAVHLLSADGVEDWPRMPRPRSPSGWSRGSQRLSRRSNPHSFRAATCGAAVRAEPDRRMEPGHEPRAAPLLRLPNGAGLPLPVARSRPPRASTSAPRWKRRP